MKKVLWLLVILGLSGCSLLSRQAPPEDVDKAATLFFNRLSAAEYDTIIADASPQFTANMAKATIRDNLLQMAAIGRIQKHQRLTMQVEGDAKQRIATAAFRVIFDQTQAEIELNFKDEGGEWKLVGFLVKQRR